MGNLIKQHKKAIIISSISVILIIVIALFTAICLKHFKNLNQNDIVSLNETELNSSIAATSDDLLFVILSAGDETLTENSETKQLEDEEKDKEEEKKAEEESKKEKLKETDKDENKNANSYYIKVNRSANTVTIYTKDANGNYTVPYKAMICSTRIRLS